MVKIELWNCRDRLWTIAYSYQKFCDWDLKLLQATQHQGSHDWQISGLPAVAAWTVNFETVALLFWLLYAIGIWRNDWKIIGRFFSKFQESLGDHLVTMGDHWRTTMGLEAIGGPLWDHWGTTGESLGDHWGTIRKKFTRNYLNLHKFEEPWELQQQQQTNISV